MNPTRALWVALAIVAACPCGREALAQNVANGRALYDGICRVCHGFPPSGGPERIANNPEVLNAAIRGVAAMGFLGSLLTQQDVRDIADYILSLSAPRPPRPEADYTDLWWNPNESGWGLNLIQHPSDVVFGVMYTYEPPDRATWLVMPGGTWIENHVYSGILYRVTGPAFNAQAFDPASVNVRPVGTATITFSSALRGTYSFSVDGTQVTKSIERQPF